MCILFDILVVKNSVGIGSVVLVLLLLLLLIGWLSMLCVLLWNLVLKLMVVIFVWKYVLFSLFMVVGLFVIIEMLLLVVVELV